MRIRNTGWFPTAAALAVAGMGLVGCTNAQTPAAPGAEAAASGGAAVFQTKCQNCHGAGGQGGSGPALAAFAGESEANLRRVIENGDGKMPAFKGQLSEAEITQVISYVKSLRS